VAQFLQFRPQWQPVTSVTVAFGGNYAVGLGGTANLAVLGGNLPSSRTHNAHSPFRARVLRTAVGRVARQNWPVARSTRNSTEWFRFSGFLVQQGALQIFHLAGRGIGEQGSLHSQSSAGLEGVTLGAF